MNSGDCCRKGTAIFRRLQPPRLDSFLRDDPLAPELLPVYSTDSGMTSIDDGDRAPVRCFTEEEKIERKRERLGQD
jgi:hypothetical protein